MCGRFWNSLSWEEYRDSLDLKGAPPDTNFRPNWNTAPTHNVLICSEHDGERRIEQMKWGLVPPWMKEKPKFSTINAKSETIEEKATWKASLNKLRCVVPISGFYEWVRREVVCVIVRRFHPAGPAVPSAVPYEVGRRGNKPSKSPRTMYPAVSRRLPIPRGRSRSASITRIRARVDGMVSRSELPKASSRKKESKVLSDSEVRSVRVSHSHPSWAKRPSAYEEEPNPIPSHIRNTVSPYCPRNGSQPVRGGDSSAGKRWRRKRTPGCNNLDTDCDIIRRESRQTSSRSPVTRPSGKSA
ncbi:SOS response-associated peptidase family protein [Henriciella aquimarina]|uniref:SOS response-associated peptidase family protein n=1 Tax=Henriciella aquimarina TaxID=545261 RepID=UPI0009FE8AF4